MNVVQVAAAGGVAVDAGLRRGCAQFLRRLLRLRLLEGWELSVLLCDDATIRALNRRYRGLDEATDVLSFSQREDRKHSARAATAACADGAAVPAGDVVVSLESLRRNARARGIGASEELKRLLIHGILHLEGLDHEGGGGQAQMIDLQEQLLREMGQGTLL